MTSSLVRLSFEKEEDSDWDPRDYGLLNKTIVPYDEIWIPGESPSSSLLLCPPIGGRRAECRRDSSKAIPLMRERCSAHRDQCSKSAASHSHN